MEPGIVRGPEHAGLSTALPLHELSIGQARIGGTKEQVHDETFFVDRDHMPITEKKLLERVKLSVLLTKHLPIWGPRRTRSPL